MGSEYMDRLAMMLAQRDPQGVGRPGAGRIADALMSRERSIPQSLPSPGVLADPEPFVSQEYFGGHDDGLRATPYTADIPDVPSRGEQRAAVMPHDPAMMDAEMDAMRGYKQSALRQRLEDERAQKVDAMRGQYGDFASEFPNELFPALDGLPIDDQGAAAMLGQMSPEDRESFYLYATQVLRDSGGSMTQPIGQLLQEWQGMTPDRRGMAVTGAKDWLGRPSEGAGRQDKQAVVRAIDTDEGRAIGVPRSGSGEVIVEDPNSPVGMRVEVMPGSEAERDLQERQRLEQAQERQMSIYSNSFFGNLDRARDMLESTWATTGGIGALLDDVPGTSAHDLQQLLVPLRSGIAFDRLQAMRDASPTGGALGAISAPELDLLRNSIASLEQSQRGEQLQQNLKMVEDAYNRIIHGDPPEDVSMAQWRDFHRQNRYAVRDGRQIQTEIAIGQAAGALQPTHRFNPQTGQIEAIQ